MAVKADGDARSTSVEKYMVLLRRYTELVLHSGRVAKGLWASTTPMMHDGIWRTLELMNGNASEYMDQVGPY
eukprot:SAG25_NODE_367_length_9118_cov_54.828578_1_plen_72_part_00